MAKIKYRDWNPKQETKERIVKINSILAEFAGQRVSVRQLYYQLVTKNIIANQDEEYRRVQTLVTDARYAGLIDWDVIEDRNRDPMRPQEFGSGRHVLESAASGFRMDRWESQPFYLELWVEKAALAGILAPICDDYHVTLMVNRGYSSASAMKESADRIRVRSMPSKVAPHGHRPTVIYIGDHDPSGEDMVRDIRDRLLEFGVPSWLDVRKLALTWDQIQEHNPPPNPVKVKDSRAQAYVDKYGDESWEVDALPPKTLDLMVRKCISSYIDKKAMQDVITRENVIKAKIKAYAAGFKDE